MDYSSYKEFWIIEEEGDRTTCVGTSWFQQVFQVDCDASGSAIGAVLSQEGKPIAYFSEKLNDAKKKYSVYD